MIGLAEVEADLFIHIILASGKFEVFDRFFLVAGRKDEAGPIFIIVARVLGVYAEKLGIKRSGLDELFFLEQFRGPFFQFLLRTVIPLGHARGNDRPEKNEQEDNIWPSF